VLRHPLPTPGNFAIEICQGTAVVDHEVGLGEAFVAAYLIGDASVGVVETEPAMSNKAFDCHLSRHIDNHDAGEFNWRCPFDQQRYVQNYDFVRLREGFPLLGHVPSHRRMDYLIYLLQFVWIIEDNFGQRGAIQFAICTNHIFPKMGDDFVEYRSAADLQLLHGGVCVDQTCPKSNKTLTSSRFSRADAPRQSKLAHHLKLHERT